MGYSSCHRTNRVFEGTGSIVCCSPRKSSVVVSRELSCTGKGGAAGALSRMSHGLRPVFSSAEASIRRFVVILLHFVKHLTTNDYQGQLESATMLPHRQTHLAALENCSKKCSGFIRLTKQTGGPGFRFPQARSSFLATIAGPTAISPSTTTVVQ